MVKGLLGARRQREYNTRETDRRAALSRGRSKTCDLFIPKDENKCVLILPCSTFTSASFTSLWRRDGPVFEHCGPTHQLMNSCQRSRLQRLFRCQQVREWISSYTKDGRGFLSETGLLHLVGRVSCSGVTPTNHGNHLLWFFDVERLHNLAQGLASRTPMVKGLLGARRQREYKRGRRFGDRAASGFVLGALEDL
ncbi:hypothetical protein NDU88_012493 [Pleurodeles waltl]|uniref:EF-hand domain-containing protein n=1 Tax=Pleurodeles waltl TaxID=8319 RepID=A0AAV7R1L7_PLEWA|nr:hypothetical protein NDU88_012493 [Pleurodeles waltl]